MNSVIGQTKSTAMVSCFRGNVHLLSGMPQETDAANANCNEMPMLRRQSISYRVSDQNSSLD